MMTTPNEPSPGSSADPSPSGRPVGAAGRVGPVRIATRQSPLALWQAETVADLLRRAKPDLEVTLVATSTFGDRRQDLSIPELGGKGVFSKEIQAMVLAGEADLAVHSAKDLQAVTPEGLVLAAIPPRGDARDALVGARLHDLPPGATVATGSNRRAALVRSLRPDLSIVGLRGNIATRLAKLDAPGIDAVVMAMAALERLGHDPAGGFAHPIDPLDAETFIPQVGQAALAVEVRPDDADLLDLVGRIDHQPSSTVVEVERGFLQELGGDCNLPAGAHGVLDPTTGAVQVRGMLASPEGDRLVRDEVVDQPSAEPGRALARRLRAALDS
jgi:hydroxymethylbilane synthase